MNKELLFNNSYIDTEQFIRKYQGFVSHQFTHYFGFMEISEGDTKLLTYSNSEESYADLYYYKEVSEILSQANLVEAEITEKENIIRFYNMVINEVLRKLKNKISFFKKNQLLTVMYCIASYIAELHARMNQILHNKNNVEHFKKVNSDYDEFEYSILKKVELEKGSTRSRATLETIKGVDKSFIQYLFPIIDTTNYLDSHHFEFTPDNFEEIYYLGVMINRLITDREIVTSKFVGNNKVRVQNSRIELSPDIQERFLNYIEKTAVESLAKNESVPDWLIQKLDQNFYKKLGFSLATLEKFILNNNAIFKDNSLARLFEKNTLVYTIIQQAKCSEEEAKKMLSFLTATIPDSSDFYLQTIDRYSNRIFENPLVSIDLHIQGLQFYLLSYPLLIHAYEILYRKLIYNLIPECQDTNSELIEKTLKKEHVHDTAAIVSKYAKKYQEHVQDFVINKESKQKKVHLTREIDLLAIANGKLFVIECKYLTFRYTSYGIRIEIDNIIGHIKNMNKKLTELELRKNEIEQYFNCTYSEVVPAIVYKHYPAAIESMIRTENVTLLSIGTFEKWFRLKSK